MRVTHIDPSFDPLSRRAGLRIARFHMGLAVLNGWLGYCSKAPVPNMKTKILIVEDDRLTRESLSKYLQLKGFEVIPCITGEEAIALTLRDQPDIILMDLGLPGMSGIEAAQVIRQQYPQISRIPIIAISGRPRELWEETALDAGISLYLSKPALPSEIVKAITQILSTPPSVNSVELKHLRTPRVA
jgi:DNA-binding response OmpR family regulator